ncbi:hypothetical protein ACNKHP_13080 [Shigella boydii]
MLGVGDLGLLATLFYITYGVSKFVSGIVSNGSNAVIYGDRAYRHWHHQHSVWLLDVAIGRLPCSGC